MCLGSHTAQRAPVTWSPESPPIRYVTVLHLFMLKKPLQNLYNRRYILGKKIVTPQKIPNRPLLQLPTNQITTGVNVDQPQTSDTIPGILFGQRKNLRFLRNTSLCAIFVARFFLRTLPSSGPVHPLILAILPNTRRVLSHSYT